nr:hypothetical protein [Tanacetum cinerariifolium]
MDRDTIQLETVVSTISQEYLLEFTFEYGISEDLHPELPGPEERIADFPEGLVEEIAAMGPRVIKKHQKRGNDGVDANAPPKVLRKDYADSRTTQNIIRGKSLASIGLETGSTFPVPTPHETPADVSDPDLLSFANLQSIPKQDVVQSSKGAVVVGNPESENTSFTSMVGSPKSICQPEWGVTNDCHLNTLKACQDLVDHIALLAQGARRDQRIQARENEIKNLEALSKPETDMKKAKEAKNAELVKELENLHAQFTDLQVFADVVSTGIAKGMSKGIKYGLEHGKANLVMEVIETYDLEADTKYVIALHALTDLKYPIVDQLESLKDALIDVIMIPVYLEVRDLKDPWSFKEEILLEDAIAANVSRFKKKKKCQVVCHTHGVGFVHHARSNDVPMSVPTVSP